MKNIFFVTLISVSSMTALAQSIPTKSPNCQKRIQVRSVPNGTGVVFDQDCSVAYVLPPLAGDLEISNPTTPAGADMCAKYNFLERKVSSIRDEILALYERIEEIRNPKGGGFGSTLPGGGGSSDLSETQKQKIAAIEAEIEGLEQKLENEDAEFEEQSEKMNDKEGSWLSVRFSWKYDALISAYAAANPNIKFARMPISRATLSFNRRINTSDARIPAVQFFDVPGIPDIRVAKEFDVPTGQKIDAIKTDEVSTEMKIFGESLGGQLVLSLKASCPLYDEGTKAMKKRISKSQLEAYFVANVTYKYYLQAFRKYHAKFNLSNFAKRVESSSKKGGLFSTKTINSLIEEKDSKDWFELTVDSDHPELTYDDISREVKADLISRVMEQIAIVNTGAPSEAPALVAPPVSGASVAAKELLKCPHIYCQGGAAILGVADAIFGSSEAVSNFIKNNDFWAEDRVEEKKMFEYYGTASFRLF